MNRKADFNMSKIAKILLVLLVLLVLAGIILIHSPTIIDNIFKMPNILKDFFKDYLGIDIEIGEQDNAELVRLDALKPDVRPVIQGIYDAIKAAQGSEQEKCVVEYPKTDGLGKDVLTFEKDTEEGGMRIRYINEHGDRMKIKEIKPLTGLEPCFVAGKTKKESIIVAQNLYENWFQGVTEKKTPEYNTGNFMISNYYDLIGSEPDAYTLEITGKSDISSGTEYYNYNHFFIYKADKGHICFMPETKTTFWDNPTLLGQPVACDVKKGEEAGLYSECFNEIKEKIPLCKEQGVPKPKQDKCTNPEAMKGQYYCDSGFVYECIEDSEGVKWTQKFKCEETDMTEKCKYENKEVKSVSAGRDMCELRKRCCKPIIEPVKFTTVIDGTPSEFIIANNAEFEVSEDGDRFTYETTSGKSYSYVWYDVSTINKEGVVIKTDPTGYSPDWYFIRQDDAVGLIEEEYGRKIDDLKNKQNTQECNCKENCDAYEAEDTTKTCAE